MSQSLFATDALFRLLVTQIEDYAIFALDVEGHVRTWNPGAARLKRYTADEIIGQSFTVFYPREVVAAGVPARLLATATATGRASDEGWRVRKDGTRFWASVLITALHDEQGRHIGFAKITRDLSERRAAEEQARKLAAEEAARLASESLARDLASTNDRLERAGEQLRTALAATEESREAAATAERFARNILESIADPFVVMDAEWRYQFLNASAACVIESVQPAEAGRLLGRSIWDLFPDVVGTKVEGSMRSAVDQRIPVSLETYSPRRRAWTRVHCYPLADGGLAVQWRNVTQERRAMETAHYLARASEILSRSLDYEETLNDLARLVVPDLADWCAVDIADGSGVLRQVAVAHVDPARVRFARELNERYPPDPSGMQGTYAVLRNGKPELYPDVTDEMLVQAAVDDEHLRISRELGLKSAIAVPLSAGNTVLGVLTLIAAESGRRYDEQDLDLAVELGRRAAIAVQNAGLHDAARAAQRRAQEANLTKSAFLATMSHELRTPLNAIAGYVELLRLGIKGAINPEQGEYLDRIQRSERYLLSLIEDVLSFAKIEAGRVELKLGPVVVAEVLDEVVSLVSPQLRTSELQLSCGPCPPNLVAYADAERTRQILLNLLSNALKFTSRGGLLGIRCDAADSAIRVIVQDSGIGIPRDKLQAIFEPFVQLDRDSAGVRAGTGLGLAISRDFARAMGGDVTAESEVGRGSLFTLTLPRLQPSD